MAGDDVYKNGHLIVAAIRVLEHQKTVPPSVEDVCRCLSLSVEQGHLMCRRLHQRGILEIIEGAYGPKLFVRNHTALEELAGEEEAPALADEVKKFQDSRKGMADKIASIKAEQKEKKPVGRSRCTAEIGLGKERIIRIQALGPWFGVSPVAVKIKKKRLRRICTHPGDRYLNRPVSRPIVMIDRHHLLPGAKAKGAVSYGKADGRPH